MGIDWNEFLEIYFVEMPCDCVIIFLFEIFIMSFFDSNGIRVKVHGRIQIGNS